MLPTLLAMLIILALAAVVVGMVVVGMEGTARHRLPEVAYTLERAGKHLNGEAEPPQALVAFFEEAEEGASDLRQLPGQILRSGSSAKSADTAGTVASARSARSARSAGTARSPRTAATARSAASSGSARSAASASRAEDAAPPVPSAPALSAWELPEVRSTWGDIADAEASEPKPSVTGSSVAEPLAAQPAAPAQAQPVRNAWAVWSSGEDE